MISPATTRPTATQATDGGRLIRFGITGLGATAIHIGIATVLIGLLAWSQVAANIAAFCLANGFSYCVNTLWSFAARLTAQSLFRFWGVSLAGLGVTTMISAVSQARHLPYLIGIALVITIVPALSFLGHRFWTYHLAAPADPLM